MTTPDLQDTPDEVVVAVDAMGGDVGVSATMAGVAQLSLEASGCHVHAVGRVDEMDAALAVVRHDPSRITFVHAPDVVTAHQDPHAVLEPDCRSSIRVAAELVARGEADALVSAGNTGAVILAASAVFARLPGVHRAALASVFPTEQRHGPRGDPFALMLDVGATVSAPAADLVGFALMGSVYSSVISEIRHPRVALLSNGTEPHKGTPAIVEAHRLLQDAPVHFTGNVEGVDLPRGHVDVVVCDGFLGNVVVKMMEGLGEVFAEAAERASERRLRWRVGLAMLGGELASLRRRTDWKLYGGAPLLGLDAVVIKAHGRSEPRAIRNAIKLAAKAHRGDLIGRITAGLAALGA